MSGHDIPKTDMIKLAESILFQPALVQHIHNGAARDLYPQHVADEMQQLVESKTGARTEGSK